MEILAPAGSKEAFLAAVNNGADAIYMSGKSFGARAYAANFELPEIGNWIKYAHLRGIKVYITVNTLIADSEMAEAVDFVVQLYKLGADAIIVQDLGLVEILRQDYPNINLSSSTQMTFHNSLGCKMAEDIGFKRVILAREVSINQMSAITKVVDVEIESFVHGALCICYSGQCLFSSMVGGRSGNRGRCAQPCRLKYQLLSGNKVVADNCHLLSPKDLKGYEHLPQLAAAGVVSAKIEGRMKRPEYVATVVKAYSEANKTLITEAQKDLEQAFNREFTSGYLLDDQGADLMSYQRPNNRGTRLGRIEDITDEAVTIKLDDYLNPGDGVEIWVTKGGRQGFNVDVCGIKGDRVEILVAGTPIITRNIRVGDRVFKTSDSKLNQAAKEAYSQYDTIPLVLALTAKIGAKPIITAMANGKSAEVTCDFIAPKAEKHPADYTSVAKQLGRVGGSGYFLQDLKVELQGEVMLPASVLNQGRRDAIAKLEQHILPKPNANIATKPLPKLTKNQHSSLKIVAVVDDYENALAALEGCADALYLNMVKWQGAKGFDSLQLAKLAAKTKIYAILPAICLEEEQDYWRGQIKIYQQAKVTGLVIGNLWALKLAQEVGWQGDLAGDLPLNIFNSYAGEFWQQHKVGHLAISPELNWQQIGNMHGAWQKEALAFGNLKVMTSQHCVLGASYGGKTANQACSKPCLTNHKYELQDEKGFKFVVKADQFCRSHIYNGHKLCVIEDLAKFINCGVSILRLDLSLQNPNQTEAVTRIYSQSLQALTSGLDPDLTSAKNEIQKFVDCPLTKGHYYRGVE